MLMLSAACLLIAGTALARVEESGGATVSTMREHCGNENFVTLSHIGGVIPDADPAGVVFGPIQTPDGETIEDVIFSADIDHTYIGDLRLWLLYDTDCDGLADVIGQVLCRPGLEGCPPDGCCGHEAWLDGWFTFDDAASTSIEEFPVGEIPTDCYAPDYDSVGLSVFDGLPSGGCFWLWGADGALSDQGEVPFWEVSLLYEDTPVERSSWGSVKGIYR
jgi:hypothetical protein